ncbi:MAG: alpha-mannosidase [Clostridia bacterium]|nr:alpha-mannosidase [Clostridia bacterium]
MKKICVHLTGSAHIDPIWLWRWQEGYAEIKATFKSALDRIAQFDEFVFTSACACYYEWVEENCPELFAEICKAVADGKWVIAGGWWIQPDCNIPSGESFARQALYSQRYFASRFGKQAEIGYCVDSFGHNGNLPQLLRKGGMRGYVYMRPDSNMEHAYPFPDGTPFDWEGIDGTTLPTCRLMDNYNQQMCENTLSQLYGIREGLAAAGMETPAVGVNYGVGNHGGGPTVKNIERIRALQAENADFEFIFSSPNGYFDAVEAARAEGYVPPRLKGDLQYHASGCYSTHSESKMNNRRAENRLQSAEKCASLAAALTGRRYDCARFERAWKQVLFNQFHDVMGGCSIRSAFDDVRESHGEALHIAAEEYNSALQKISWAIDTEGPAVDMGKCDGRLWAAEGLGAPVVIFNPHAWEIETPVTVAHSRILKVTDASGKLLPMQKVRAERTDGDDKEDTLFMARVPALGYTVCWVFLTGEERWNGARKLITSPYTLENKKLRLHLDPLTGDVDSLYLKEKKVELVRGGAAKPLVLDESDLDTWGHGVFTFDHCIGRFGEPEFTVLETGPVRARIAVRTKYEGSELVQTFTLYAEADQVEVECRVFWRESHKMLKLAFQTAAEGGEAIYEIPGGAIRKPCDGCEEPTQNWAAVENGEIGLAVLNNGRYSYCCRGAELRMIALRGAAYADHYGFARTNDGRCRFMEQGEREFTYVLRPYAGTFADNRVVEKGWELNAPAVSVNETYHKGSLPLEMSGIEISGEGLVLSALKSAEDGRGIILRAYESRGRHCDARIRLPLFGADIRRVFRPYEVCTFRIAEGAVTEVDFVENEL